MSITIIDSEAPGWTCPRCQCTGLHYDQMTGVTSHSGSKLQCRACYARDYRRQRRVKHPTCEVCNEVFETTRTDATYCSPSCRQWAYRRRRSQGRDNKLAAAPRLALPATNPKQDTDSRKRTPPIVRINCVRPSTVNDLTVGESQGRSCWRILRTYAARIKAKLLRGVPKARGAQARDT
jgi:hypothetical protein